VQGECTIFAESGLVYLDEYSYFSSFTPTRLSLL